MRNDCNIRRRLSQGTKEGLSSVKVNDQYRIEFREIIEGEEDELEFRGISQRRLATLIGVPASRLNEVLNAKRPLSAELALLIGQALDIEAAPLLARDKSFLERLKEIPRIAAIF